jgi:hypothetical protein
LVIGEVTATTPEGPWVPSPPATEIIQEVKVPEPPTLSTFTVIEVSTVRAVMAPSRKFAGVTEFATRTRVPTLNAPVDAKFRVLDPLEIATEVVEVRLS